MDGVADKRKKAKRKRRKGRHITFRKIQVLRNVKAKKQQYNKKIIDFGKISPIS